MRLFSGLFIGKESLTTHGTALATAADNVANANTTGFKQQRTDFANLLAESVGSMYGETVAGGDGVRATEITTVHNQGVIEHTQRMLDFAVTGDGFFIINDGLENLYTRAGNFFTNEEGELVTTDGHRVQGFTEESPDTLTSLTLNGIISSAEATTEININGNLDSREDLVPLQNIPQNPVNFRLIEQQSTFTNAVRAVDSLGDVHDVSLYFFHTGNLDWQVNAYVDAEDVGGVAGTPVLVGQTQIAFQADGVQDPANAASIAVDIPWGNGSLAGNFNIDLTGFTGYGNRSFLNSVTRDGIKAGSVVGVFIERNGSISARLNSGETIPIGTLALAKFNNNTGLHKIGDNNYFDTPLSGEPSVGAPSIDGRGEVLGEALEGSTVDLAKEFVDMMRFQRGYQAGSQVIQTMDELLNQTIQLA